MRSLWVNRLFRQVHGDDRGVAAVAAGSAIVMPSHRVGKNHRVEVAVTTNSKRFARMCLGIGDGSVHKQ